MKMKQLFWCSNENETTLFFRTNLDNGVAELILPRLLSKDDIQDLEDHWKITLRQLKRHRP